MFGPNLYSRFSFLAVPKLLPLFESQNAKAIHLPIMPLLSITSNNKQILPFFPTISSDGQFWKLIKWEITGII
jgi:hypothetical protein